MSERAEAKANRDQAPYMLTQRQLYSTTENEVAKAFLDACSKLGWDSG